MKKPVKITLTLLCVVILVSSWVVQAYLLQHLLEDLHYIHPYVTSYIVHCGYCIMLIPGIVIYKLTSKKLVATDSDPKHPEAVVTTHGLRKRVLLGGLLYAFLTMFGAVLWYVSLSRTTVAVNTSIYNSSFVVVFIASLFVLKKKLRVHSAAAVLIAVAGVLMVSLSSNGSDHKDNTLWGILAVVGSMLSWAAYEVTYAKIYHEYNSVPSLPFLVLGMTGAFNLVFMWLGVIVVHYSGLNPFHWPDLAQLKMLLAIASLDTVLNAALFAGIAVSGPTPMAVGSLLTIPVSMVSDWLLQRKVMPPVGIAGAVLILVSFLLMEFGGLIIPKLCAKRNVEETKRLVQHSE